MGIKCEADQIYRKEKREYGGCQSDDNLRDIRKACSIVDLEGKKNRFSRYGTARIVAPEAQQDQINVLLEGCILRVHH